MKIEKIDTFEEGKIIVTVSGYPHAQPVFDATLTKEELETALIAWQKNQDEVDAINEARKTEHTPVPVDISALKVLEGKTVVEKVVEIIK